jgi:hypothetical protein
MDDLSLTALFTRMDNHLQRQDLALELITATLQQQNAVLASMAQLLAVTSRVVEETARDLAAQRATDREARATDQQITAELLRALMAVRERLEARGY